MLPRGRELYVPGDFGRLRGFGGGGGLGDGPAAPPVKLPAKETARAESLSGLLSVLWSLKEVDAALADKLPRHGNGNAQQRPANHLDHTMAQGFVEFGD